MQSEGHSIRLWIKEDKWKEVYDGLLPKVKTWKDSVQWADFIVFDHTGMTDIWKQVYKIKPCFGGSEWADKLEKDRPYAKSVFKQIGLKDFESLKVNTIQEAIAHLQKHKVKHVVKPVGKDVDSHHIIIGEDNSGEDACELLACFDNQGLKPDYLEIEERKTGIEVGVSIWSINGYFSGPININFEHKRLASGYPEGCGPLTGEMGTAMIYQPQDNPFFQRTIAKIAPILKQHSYKGQIDISFIVDRNGEAWPLEATPRLGYPACMIEQALQISSFADLFYYIAKGQTFENKVSLDWAIGIVCIMPGFPSNDEVTKRSVGIPVFGPYKQVHLVEVKMGKSLNGERLVTSKGFGYPMVITGTGKTIQEAKATAYHQISNSNYNRIRVPNMVYRHDIGDRVIRQMDDLIEFGIIESNPMLSLMM